MTYTYSYDEEFQCLYQRDETGRLVSSMYMPKNDLHKIAFLDWVYAVDETAGLDKYSQNNV